MDEADKAAMLGALQLLQHDRDMLYGVVRAVVDEYDAGGKQLVPSNSPSSLIMRCRTTLFLCKNSGGQ